MYRISSFGDFRCVHCRTFVSTEPELSGVNNRNHCPYCLWSCHLDLYAAGDRLSACKAGMKPIGLTTKKSRNKYQSRSRGELMLIHECMECGAISINRIAADDDAETVVAVFQGCITLDQQVHILCSQYGILPLQMDDMEMVKEQLYGQRVDIPYAVWQLMH